MIDSYSRAYTEVLEVLRYLPKEDYDRIPKEKIEFYEQNKDSDYQYTFNESYPIEEQILLPKTHAVLLTLFRDYFCNDKQRKSLKDILEINYQISENEKRKKYGNHIIFKKRKKKTEN